LYDRGELYQEARVILNFWTGIPMSQNAIIFGKNFAKFKYIAMYCNLSGAGVVPILYGKVQ
jgi:hypothetical protein